MRALLLLPLFFLFSGCEVIPVKYPVYGPTSSTGNPGSSESREFEDLWAKDQVNKKKETAEVLTYLLNETDIHDAYTGAVITNESNCNIIVRMVAIKGEQIYNLPIKPKSKNQFKILKGTYTLKSKICGANYYSQKFITDPLVLKLSN